MQAQTQSSAARLSARSLFSTPPTQPPHGETTLPCQAGLAHDAGNLLHALGLYCDLLLQPGVLRPEHSHYATELSLISARSGELIQRLLANDNFRAQTTSAPSSLRELEPVLHRIAGPAIQVTVEVPSSLPALPFPVEALERITVNLVLNAAQALQASGKADGRIQITLGLFAGHLQLIVEDNGPGIPPGLAAAFLRPTPLPPGAVRGIGHRVVHELTTATEGQLAVRVRPGNGTVFCLKWKLPDAPLITHTATKANAA